jgi:hypothetical protein
MSPATPKKRKSSDGEDDTPIKKKTTPRAPSRKVIKHKIEVEPTNDLGEELSDDEGNFIRGEYEWEARQKRETDQESEIEV